MVKFEVLKDEANINRGKYMLPISIDMEGNKDIDYKEIDIKLSKIREHKIWLEPKFRDDRVYIFFDEKDILHIKDYIQDFIEDIKVAVNEAKKDKVDKETDKEKREQVERNNLDKIKSIDFN